MPPNDDSDFEEEELSADAPLTLEEPCGAMIGAWLEHFTMSQILGVLALKAEAESVAALSEALTEPDPEQAAMIREAATLAHDVGMRVSSFADEIASLDGGE